MYFPPPSLSLSQTHIRTFYIPNMLTTKIKPRMCRLPFKYFPDSIQVKAKHKSWEREARKQGQPPASQVMPRA